MLIEYSEAIGRVGTTTVRRLVCGPYQDGDRDGVIVHIEA